MVKSLSIARAVNEYLELEKNDNSIIEFYARYEDIFENIDCFNDENEFYAYIRISYDYSLSIMSKYDFQKASEILLKLIYLVSSNTYKAADNLLKYCVYNLGVCYFRLKKYDEADKLLSSHISSGLLKNDYDAINLHKAVKIRKFTRIENASVACWIGTFALAIVFLKGPIATYCKLASLAFIIITATILYLKHHKLYQLSIIDFLTRRPIGISMLTFLGAIFFALLLWPHKTNTAMGVVLRDVGAYEMAVSRFTKAIENRPNYATAYNDRGITYYYQRRLEEAKRDYDRAIKLSELPVYYLNRGLASLLAGESVVGLEDLKKAEEMGKEIDYQVVCFGVEDECKSSNWKSCASMEYLRSANVCR